MKLNFHNLFMRGSLKPVLQAQLVAQQDDAITRNPVFQYAKHEFMHMADAETLARLRVIMALATDKNRLSDQHLALFDHEDTVSFRLVRTANSLSPAAGEPRRIVSNSREAIEKIGFAAVRELAAAAAASKLFQFDGIWQSCSDEDFWLHSVATAIASRRLYQQLFGVSAADMLPYLAGLLHDIGIVAAHRTLGTTAEYRQALFSHLQQQRPLDREEEAVLGFNHADLGAAILDGWHLPAELCEAAHRHHRHPRGVAAAETSPLVHVIRIADDMALRIPGAGHPDFVMTDEALLGESLRFLELGTAEWANLMAAVVNEWDQLARLGWFQGLRPRFEVRQGR